MEGTQFAIGPYRRRALSLGDLARAALPQLRRAISGRAELRLSVAPRMPPVFVDRASIERMLLQLVLHAAGTTQLPCGAVELGVASLAHGPGVVLPSDSALACPCSVEFVRLTVTDNGTGMDVATFHDVARWLEGPHWGSAGVSLRLRAIRRIVRDHGGQMSIDAFPNGPTTVRVELPALGRQRPPAFG
jgi:signal transduction histidine kinase